MMTFTELVEASAEYSIDVKEMKKLAVYFFGDDLEGEYNKAMANFGLAYCKSKADSQAAREARSLMERASFIFKGEL